MTEGREATAYIKRNSDGLVRRFSTEWHDSDFIWCDGNFACDCNRSDFFAQAGGEAEEEDAACGSSRFTVLRIVLADGTVVYAEDEDEDEDEDAQTPQP